jgi:hypothetical protein
MQSKLSSTADPSSVLTLSVIAPFFDEEASIGPVHAAIVAAVTPYGIPFDVVCVGDLILLTHAGNSKNYRVDQFLARPAGEGRARSA